MAACASVLSPERPFDLSGTSNSTPLYMERAATGCDQLPVGAHGKEGVDAYAEDSRDRRASWRAGCPRTKISLHRGDYAGSLQNRCGRVTHGSVGSTPAPLRSSTDKAPHTGHRVRCASGASTKVDDELL
jgi:hypothetical protein